MRSNRRRLKRIASDLVELPRSISDSQFNQQQTRKNYENQILFRGRCLCRKSCSLHAAERAVLASHNGYTRGWRPDHHCFRFKRAVILFQTGAAHMFVFDDVSQGRSSASLGYSGSLCDLEDAGFLFSGNRECLRVLVHCRDHSVKWDRPCALLRWRSGWRCGRFWRGWRRTCCPGDRLRVERHGKSQTRDAKDDGEMKVGSHNLLGPRWLN